MRSSLLVVLLLAKKASGILLPGWSSSAIAHVVRAWMEAYMTAHDDVELSLDQAEDDIDTTLWSIGRANNREGHLKLPAAVTSVAMVASVPFQSISTSSDTVAAIFNGTIESWSRFDSLLPDIPIRTVVRIDDTFERSILSDTLGISLDDWRYNTTVASNSLVCFEDAWGSSAFMSSNVSAAPQAMRLETESSDAMTSTLLRVPYSVGFLDVGLAQSFQNSLAVFAVDGTLPWNVSSNYPLSGSVYWDLATDGYESCLQAVNLVQFVQWTFESELARSIAQAYGYKMFLNVSMISEQLYQIVCLDKATNTTISALDYVNAPVRPISPASNSSSDGDRAEESSESSRRVLWIACSMVVACLIIMAFTRQLERRKSETFWRIRKKEIMFEQPQVVLGTGSFGQVLLAKYRGTQVAVKRVVPNQVISDDATGSAVIQLGNNLVCTRNGKCSVPSTHTQLGRKGLIEELRILSRLRHNNITTVVGAVLENRGEPMIVMEYLEQGSLYNVLHHSYVLDGEMILPILQDIVQGMRFLHSANPPIVHSDLKAKNVLLDRRYRAKITDFGLSIASKPRACGTPFWMAPELLSGEHKNTTASDVYAFAMVLYEIFTRKTPYQGENPDEVLPKVRDWAIKLRPSPPYRMSPPCRSIYEECLEFLPAQRPTAEELESRLQRLNPHHLGCGVDGKTVESNADDLPEDIKQALHEGKDIPDEVKEVVTIIVADVHNLEPLKLKVRRRAAILEEADEIFRELAEAYELTIPRIVGDAFVAVANIDQGQSHDHAKRCALFATDLLAATHKIQLDPDKPTSGCLQFGVAIHCGPITCSVIGNRTPRYALSSEETIHFAELLQKSGQPGRIQCIHKTFCVLRKQMPELRFALRGRIPVKGSGTQNTYWINEGEAMPQLSPKKVTMPSLPKSKTKNTIDSSPFSRSSAKRTSQQSIGDPRSEEHHRPRAAHAKLLSTGSGHQQYYTMPKSLNGSPIPQHSYSSTGTASTGLPQAPTLTATSPYRPRSCLRSSDQS